MLARETIRTFASPAPFGKGGRPKGAGGFVSSLWEKVSGDGSGYRFTVAYTYDAYGNLVDVHNAQQQSIVYWQATSRDAFGHVTGARLGNGLMTHSTYDPATGRLHAISTGRAGTPTAVQNLSYAWDAIGNLEQRTDLNRSLTESFTYDAVNRLTQTVLNSEVTQAVSYTALGNIAQRTTPGTATTFVYDLAGLAGPHAVTALKDAGGVITESYQYDANGNLTSGGGRTLTWNAANYPIQITQGSRTTGFTYGPARQRVTQTEYQSGSLIQTTVSIGALFEQTTEAATGAITYRHFIRAGSQTIAIHTRTSAYTQTTSYLHRDHLGSISALTNEDGDVIARLSFDAWGNRRDPADWSGPATAPATTTRGYTGHKMLDEVGLIHMNGRVYDPGIGRFVSADPYVQAPFNSQSFNRYSYVFNNPLSFVDPSGFLVNRQFFSADDGCDPADCTPLGTVTVTGDGLADYWRNYWFMWYYRTFVYHQRVRDIFEIQGGVPPVFRTAVRLRIA